jgi:hypothetical protein
VLRARTSQTEQYLATHLQITAEWQASKSRASRTVRFKAANESAGSPVGILITNDNIAKSRQGILINYGNIVAQAPVFSPLSAM